MVVSDQPDELTREGIDVALRYGDGHWPRLRTRRLFGVESFPVCAPGYLDGSVHALEDWRWWLEKSGVPLPQSHRVVGFDNYANVIQAALEGQGIALGFSGILDGLLERGTLVRSLETRQSKGLSVYLAVPSGQAPSTVAQRFRGWILDEAGAPNPR